MAKIFEHILNRSLAHVTRFNNRPQHFEESVAEHTFYVAYFVLIICSLLEKKKIKVDTKKALQKSLVDLWNEEQAALSIEAQIVKVADKLSLLSKCFEEIQAGNSYFAEIYKWQL